MKNCQTEKQRNRSNAQLKVVQYCTCGRKFVGNPAWASHQRWADRHGVGSEHKFAGTHIGSDAVKAALARASAR